MENQNIFKYLTKSEIIEYIEHLGSESTNIKFISIHNYIFKYDKEGLNKFNDYLDNYIYYN